MKNRITDKLESMANGKRDASMSNDGMHQLASNVGTQAKHVQRKAEQLITSHPVAALSVAVVTGLALGWWVKRK